MNILTLEKYVLALIGMLIVQLMNTCCPELENSGGKEGRREGRREGGEEGAREGVKNNCQMLILSSPH